MKLNYLVGTAILFAALASPTIAQTIEADSRRPGEQRLESTGRPSMEVVRTRAEQTVAIFNKQLGADEFFVPEAPVERLLKIMEGVSQQNGKAISISDFQSMDTDRATFTVKFERGEMSLRIRVDGSAPHLVNALGPVS